MTAQNNTTNTTNTATMTQCNQSHVSSAIDYFLRLADIEQSAYLLLPFESPAWQFHRDRYVNLSNAAAQLMGEEI